MVTSLVAKLLPRAMQQECRQVLLDGWLYDLSLKTWSSRSPPPPWCGEPPAEGRIFSMGLFSFRGICIKDAFQCKNPNVCTTPAMICTCGACYRCCFVISFISASQLTIFIIAEGFVICFGQQNPFGKPPMVNCWVPGCMIEFGSIVWRV